MYRGGPWTCSACAACVVIRSVWVWLRMTAAADRKQKNGPGDRDAARP